MKLGVCYYPEHWPESRWAEDAAHMRTLGISMVRIGEFAWSRLEDADGSLHFDWLQRAIDILHKAGHHVVLGTPTASPPRWMLTRHPDMLAVDAAGQVRGFGSRRHYCFSSDAYRSECERIVTHLAERFGQHPGVCAWQTDNEYGCHSTTVSYSPNALNAFQHWCRERYGDIDTLNTAWGNVFWSMELTSFDDIVLPVGAVTETCPAHRLAFWRFSSDQVVRFNRAQTDILRRLSPGRDIVHNFMGHFVEFDHHAVARDLDVASWDNYPLGFLTRDSSNAQDQHTWLRTGHPDSSAFHHDLYRGCCGGRWWVMEQQPGPVNWAPHNPSPLPGMVRLWGWEAFAHGAEVMSCFRWRQAPFAQEQMHTGLLLSNGDEDVAAAEVAKLATEVRKLVDSGIDVSTHQAPVALLFDYVGDQLQRIQQPDGQTHDPLEATLAIYTACRQLGQDVDILPIDADLSSYAVVLCCNLTCSDPALAARLSALDARVVLFPRCGSRSDECSIPDELPPGAFQQLIDLQVIRSETLPPSSTLQAGDIQIHSWRECIRSSLAPAEHFADGWGFHYSSGKVDYFNALPDATGLVSVLEPVLRKADLQILPLPAGVRIRRLGALQFLFNYGPGAVSLSSLSGGVPGLQEGASLLLGNHVVEPAELAFWLVEPLH